MPNSCIQRKSPPEYKAMPFTRYSSTATTAQAIDDFLPQETYETLGDCLNETYGVLPFVTTSVHLSYIAISNSPTSGIVDLLLKAVDGSAARYQCVKTSTMVNVCNRLGGIGVYGNLLARWSGSKIDICFDVSLGAQPVVYFSHEPIF